MGALRRVVHSSAFDVLSMRMVKRLKMMDRGTLNGSRTALTSNTFGQCWTLDSTGNWQGFREATDGNGLWDLIQQRTANPVNEITSITNSLGSAWSQPVYNRAGNMTTLPQPNSPGSSYTATYDAWNRLVKLVDTGSAHTVAEYQYDGAKRRIVQKSYSSGTLSETRHCYFTQPSQWQVIEERLGTTPDSASPDRQFVWGLRYIDDLILRDRSVSGGSLNERLYATQDANWNLTALCNSSGTVLERYAYSAYGDPQFLTASFVPTSSNNAIEYLYCTYRFDQLTCLYPIRHRVYHPILGAWIARDPATDAVTLSRLLSQSDKDIITTLLTKVVATNPTMEGPQALLEWNRLQGVDSFVQTFWEAEILITALQMNYRLFINLYNYGIQNPGRFVDRRGLSIIEYGRYCGPYRFGPGAPIDDLDYCCKDHDDCYRRLGCTAVHGGGRWFGWGSRASLSCDAILKACASGISCAAMYPTNPARRARCAAYSTAVTIWFY